MARHREEEGAAAQRSLEAGVIPTGPRRPWRLKPSPPAHASSAADRPPNGAMLSPPAREGRRWLQEVEGREVRALGAADTPKEKVEESSVDCSVNSPNCSRSSALRCAASPRPLMLHAAVRPLLLAWEGRRHEVAKKHRPRLWTWWGRSSSWRGNLTKTGTWVLAPPTMRHTNHKQVDQFIQLNRPSS